MIKSINFEIEDEGSEYEEGEESDQLSDGQSQKLKYNEDEEVIHGEEKPESSLDSSEGMEEKSAGEENDDDNAGDFDGIEGLDIDDNDEEDTDKLVQLLFCVQSFGNFKDEKRRVYEKSPFCETSMRDVHRFLNKDDPEDPKCKYSMLAWKIAENDIIPLMMSYENNETIQKLGLVLLTDLTVPLPEIMDKRTTIESLLTDLQEYIVNSKLIELVSRTLADSTAKLREASIMRNELRLLDNAEESKFEETNEEQRNKAKQIKAKIAEVENKSQIIIELIFTFLKQLLNIVHSNSINKTVQNNITLLKKFSQLKIFEAIVFHSQNFESEFYKRMSITILELVFTITRPFTVNNLFDLYNQVNNSGNNSGQLTTIQKLVEEEKRQKMMRQAMYSTRPNSFNTMIKVTRPLDGTSFIVSNVTQLVNNPQKVISDKMNQFGSQRKKPRRNFKPRKTKSEMPSKTFEEVKLVNDFKIAENFQAAFDYTHKEIIIAIKSFCEDFLKHCFNQLIRHFYVVISLKERIEKYDIYHIISVMTFFLEYNRFSEHSFISQEKSKGKISKSHEFNATMVVECLIPDLMNQIYEIAFNESIKAKKSELKLFELYSSIRYIKQMLLLSFDLYKYKSDANLQYNSLIQDCILTKDFSKIIRAIFALYNQNYHPRVLLYESIELTEVYFSSLDLYASKRKLMIKKKKKRVARKEDDNEEELAKKMQKEDEAFIEKDPNQSADDEGEHTGNVSLSEDEKFEYLERDLKVEEEMKVLLDYTVISRILALFYFRDNSAQKLSDIKKDPTNIARFISKIFNRIIHTLKEPWIFYQMEYLYIFHNLVNDAAFANDVYFQPLYNSILAVLKCYFDTLRKNKLLIVESLFRFSSPIIKDHILNNYDEWRVEEGKKPDNFDDDFRDFEGENIYDPSEEAEYDGTNINLVKITGKNKTKEKEKIKKVEVIEEVPEVEEEEVKWTENEDLLLIRNYLDFKDHNEVMDILNKLFVSKTKKDIKRRIKKLKLKKGEDRAMKKFRKLHKKKKVKEKEENLFNVIIELSHQCKDANKKLEIEKTINMLRQQLESLQVRKGLLDNLSENDCTIIPTSTEEIETLNNPGFQTFIKTIGLIPPEVAESEVDDLSNSNKNYRFWKLNPNCDVTDIAIMIEKLNDFEREVNQNIEVIDPEREEEFEKAITEKKKKLKKREKKKKLKKKREKRSFEEEREYGDSVNGEKNIMGEKDNSIVSGGYEEVNKNLSHSVVSHSKYSNNKADIYNKSMKSVKPDNESSISLLNEDNSKKKKKRLKKGLKEEDDYFNFD